MTAPKKMEVDTRTMAIVLSVMVTIIVAATGGAFAYGVSTTESKHSQMQIDQLDRKIQEVRQQAFEYTTQEVGGLRGDVHTMDNILQKQIDEIK